MASYSTKIIHESKESLVLIDWMEVTIHSISIQKNVNVMQHYVST